MAKRTEKQNVLNAQPQNKIGAKSKIKPKMRLTFLLLLIPVLYIIYATYPIIFKKFETQVAMLATVNSSVITKGIAIRQEELLTQPAGGTVSYSVKDGARVSAGSLIANVYATDQIAQNVVAIQNLRDEIDVLKRSQDPSNITGTDIDLLLKQIRANVYSLLDISDGTNMQNLAQVKNALTFAFNKLHITTGAETDFLALTQQLEAELAALEAATGGAIEQRTTSIAGYFVKETDGFEQTASPDAVHVMNAEQLAAFISGEHPAAAAYLGKIVLDYKWQFAATITGEKAALFKKGSQVTVQFANIAGKQLPMVVTAVDVSEDGKLCKLMLECSYIDEDTAGMRIEPVELIASSYTGLKVDKAALHIVEGAKGVYIKYGNTAIFKPVEIIYETNDFILISETTNENSKLKMYDEVITKGSNLYDGKLL